ncbi:ankyrin repeat and SOCS box protein 8 isoform X4 [Pipistrellus kuhlii]|uniref:ankyrin repeat and SOCS box protein 8 isoform X4 n=1 Tax=Pipistrellus kuhlii TaxID=59472 RepID=UPI001E26EDC3|nr:ankyrin repeat and SOCS box protein 8 isoform X4 [Pipistrellus kuhlii]
MGPLRPHLGRCGPTEWVQQLVNELVPTAADPSREAGKPSHIAPARKASGPAEKATGGRTDALGPGRTDALGPGRTDALGPGRTDASRVCAGAALLRALVAAQAQSSPLFKSCKQGSPPVTTSASGSLLDSRSHDPAQPPGSGADVNCTHGTLKPLHCACMVSDADCVELLLEKGAELLVILA